MYYVNKIAGWVTSPLGLAFLGIAFGWLLRRGRSGIFRALGCLLAVLSLAFLWVMSLGATTGLIGPALERPWERAGLAHGSVEGLPDADAIVVLGGGVGAHEKCHAPELFAGADRVWQGARLYRAKKGTVPGLKVYCTGGGCEFAALPLLVDLGVPREAVWFSEEPRNTEEEARLIRSEIGAQAPRILLVTSAWHMTRAKMLFERAGFDVVPAPTDFEMNCARERKWEVGDFFPSAEALARNSYAIKEWVAQFGYRFLRR